MRTSRHRQGFALPAVLAVTGVVTLVFLVAMTALASLNAEAGSARARVRFLQRVLTAEAAVAYLAATEPLSSTAFAVGGPRIGAEFDETASDEVLGATSPVSMVRLDARPYRLQSPENLVLRIQDQGGMLNLASLSDDQWRAFGQAAGLSPSLASQLGPLYRDYVDPDSLVGPGGAEQAAYGRQKVANRMLRRPSEWLSLLDVRSGVNSGRWRAVREHVGVDHTRSPVNINTASAPVLQIWFGLSETQAASAIRARETSPFNSLMDLAAASGAGLTGDTELLYTAPTGRVVYTIQDTQSAWTYRARLTMTPSGLEQPVWIDQTELTEAPRRAVADITDATDFPYAPR